MNEFHINNNSTGRYTILSIWTHGISINRRSFSRLLASFRMTQIFHRLKGQVLENSWFVAVILGIVEGLTEFYSGFFDGTFDSCWSLDGIHRRGSSEF